MLVERFRSPCEIALTISKHTATGFDAVPIGGPEIIQAYRCDGGAYVFTPDGFELRTKLGQVAARFRFIGPIKQK